MEAKWHVAIQNDVITEYAGMRLKDYYGSPQNMLEAQLKAAEYAERKFGLGRFIKVFIDSPCHVLASMFGVEIIYPAEDEVPSNGPPVLDDLADADKLRVGDLQKDGLMAKRWEAYLFLKSKGYQVDVAIDDGSVVTTSAEIFGTGLFYEIAANPEGVRRLFDRVVNVQLAIRRLGESVSGRESPGSWLGDDFAGLLSPKTFRELVVPYYQKLFAGRTTRLLHSELFRVEHLRLAKDLLDITRFHGAAARNMTLAEMHSVMGPDFTAQLAPDELLKYSPAEVAERIKVLAGSGAGEVQIFPGRSTPDRNMEAAISAAREVCPGGPAW